MNLFSYKTERAAARTLAALRKSLPETTFRLEMRYDWRLYIKATNPDGTSGFVQKRPLNQFGKEAH